MKKAKQKPVKVSKKAYPNMYALMEVIHMFERLGYTVKVC